MTVSTPPRALVVYESMFGNTQTVAEAIADGLAGIVVVDLAEVGSLETLPADLDLLVVGGPTHAFGMSRPSTRRSAADQAKEHLVSHGIGVREWLDTLGTTLTGTPFAAFDTRVRRPRLPGSAARAIDRRLRRSGARAIAGPTTFYVEGTPGPLADGELQRARDFGRSLAAEHLVNH